MPAHVNESTAVDLHEKRQLEGTVTEIGITYLQLDTGNRVMYLPNSQVLAAGVSRQAPAVQPNGSGQAG